jgi:hypothetical protein
VLETDVPSKANALNLGDDAATVFPRVYVDADVVLSFQSLKEIAAALEKEGVLAVAPAVETVFPPGASWPVRAYYEFWMALPYIREGMMAAGVYAANQEGRNRFGRFPAIIADDGYFRLQFTSSERVEVPSALSTVSAPGNFWDLIRIKTRSRLGGYQLRAKFPELFEREARSKDYRGSLRVVASNPRLWPAAFPYLLVNLISRWRARDQAKKLGGYVWERDTSSRAVSP